MLRIVAICLFGFLFPDEFLLNTFLPGLERKSNAKCLQDTSLFYRNLTPMTMLSRVFEIFDDIDFIKKLPVRRRKRRSLRLLD